MNFRDSSILQTTIRKLVPFAVMFAIYIFSYGSDLPGGGFQAGVVFGTIIVVLELAFDARLYSNRVYQVLEMTGVVILLILLYSGFILHGTLFGTLYSATTGAGLFPNPAIWLMNLAIFLEVLSSMVLIFRYFISWKEHLK